MAAKPKPNDKPTETPLVRTRQLARKLLAVPKAEVDKQRAREQQRKK